jgi:hypothetical protein
MVYGARCIPASNTGIHHAGLPGGAAHGKAEVAVKSVDLTANRSITHEFDLGSHVCRTAVTVNHCAHKKAGPLAARLLSLRLLGLSALGCHVRSYLGDRKPG